MLRTEVIEINKNAPDIEKIKRAVFILEKGGVVAFPTETVYGLGANYKNKYAIEKLYEIKERPKDKQFSLLVRDVKEIDNLAIDILPVAYRLADRFWPGPLTIVLKKRDYQTQTIGLRMPKSPVALGIVRLADFPIVCPSANLSGKRPSLNTRDVLEDLEGKIDLILDGGQVELGTPSTVVDACSQPIKILRQGFIDDKSIQEVSLKKRVLFICTGNSCRSVMAKALLEKKLSERGRTDIEVFSAGISAAIGMEPTLETKQLSQEEGIDVSSYRSQRINEDMLKRSDLILVMERLHEESILRKNPNLRNRLYLLKEFSKFDHNNLEIEDPIGKGIEVYRKSFLDIKVAIDRLINLV